jgi:cation:H+ antiporter
LFLTGLPAGLRLSTVPQWPCRSSQERVAIPGIDGLAATLLAFFAAAAVIAIAGTRLARIADAVAARTGMGEAMVGALFVSASTSLPGAITSVVTAAQGHVSLATGNALGGIAAQTAFLAVADLAYRRANLEHAAASVANMVQGALLVALLTLPLLAANLPPVYFWGISPATPVIVLAYIGGLHLIRSASEEPMWQPEGTHDTKREEDDPPDEEGASTAVLWAQFAALAAVLAAMGFVVSGTGTSLVALTGLSETAVGALFTAIATSLPELVIAVAAVRMGALNLAVGNIIGGNCFDILFLAGADVAYRGGSIYAHFGASEHLLSSITILMTSVVLLGLLHRQRRGFARIGFESSIMLGLYAFLLVILTR